MPIGLPSMCLITQQNRVSFADAKKFPNIHLVLWEAQCTKKSHVVDVRTYQMQRPSFSDGYGGSRSTFAPRVKAGRGTLNFIQGVAKRKKTCGACTVVVESPSQYDTVYILCTVKNLHVGSNTYSQREWSCGSF